MPNRPYGSGVTYTLVYVKSDRTSSGERWVGKLTVAQAVARRAVADGVAARVEILNADGKLIFQVPR